jgi:hypothetical protein
MADFTINGQVGDAFIRITADKEVQLIFGETEDSIIEDVSWDGHEVYKCAVQFSLMIDSYLRNSKALDDLIVSSPTGSIPAELIGRDLLPIYLAGAGLEEFNLPELEKEEVTITQKEKYTDNIIQFKHKDKNDEDE